MLGLLTAVATQAVALDISKVFDRVWHVGLLHKLKSYRISCQIFGLISSFLSNRQLQVILDEKSSMLEFLKAPFLVLHFSYNILITFPDDVICDFAIYADDTAHYSKCDQTCDLWQQLELACELESDLRGTVDWGRKWLVDFNAGQTQLVSFDRLNNTGAIDVKMDGSALEEKSSFKILGLTFSSILDWVMCLAYVIF